MAYIGIGSTSKYNIYIIIASLSNIFSFFLIGFNSLNMKRTFALLGFLPKLKRHYFFQMILEYLGFIIGGIILYFLFEKNDKKNLPINIIEKTISEISLQSKFSSSQKNKKEIYRALFLVALFYTLNLFIRGLIYSNFGSLDLWMIEILFISFFSCRILKIKINKHKLVAMFIIVPILVMKLISNLLPETKHSNVENNGEYLSDYNILKFIE